MKKLYKNLWILLGVLSIQEMANGVDDITSRWRIATVSTLYGNFTAKRAVDGDRGTCVHSNTGTNQWWSLELWHQYQVDTIAITNADSPNYQWINGAVIRVGNSATLYSNPVCAEISTIESGQTANFSCGLMEGRYVFVHIPGNQKTLVLCEVQIYGYLTENVALWRSVSMSSQYADWEAIYAVDRLRDTCTCTSEETNPWFRVDLLHEYQVNKVAITNREDLNTYQRINGAVLRVGNFPDDIYSNPICAKIATIYSGTTETYSCGMVGRYVIVHIPGDQKILSICELDVYGQLIGNLASNGIAAQSSTSWDWFSEKAIDGCRGLHVYRRGCCSSTTSQTNPWWRLDLSNVYRVGRVVVTNRNDCCTEQINGAEIRIGNSLENNGNNNPICAVIPAIPGGSYSYSCGAMEGRYVNLIIPGNMKTLTLCEVEVYDAGPVVKKSVVKMMFNSKADLTDQTMRENILKKLGSALADRGITNVTLSWFQAPAQVTQEVQKAPKSCVKIP